MEQKKNLILLAGGIGRRMQSDLPKQFIELEAKPVFIHTLSKFLSAAEFHRVIIVIHESWRALLEKQLKEYQFESVQVICGGSERFHSVKNGLSLLEPNPPAGSEIVAVQDAVRPCLSLQLIESMLEAAKTNAALIPAVPIYSSLRKQEKDMNYSISRDGLFVIQTPQIFDLNLLQQAYQQDYQPDFTDDASVVEALGHSIHLHPGEKTNIKITSQEDIQYASWILSRQ